jgi:hypothetical protein
MVPGGTGGATIGKTTCFILKKEIFSRTSKLISIKLGKTHPLVKGILNFSIKEPVSLQKEYNHKNAKI